jgi:hypothetical protein
VQGADGKTLTSEKVVVLAVPEHGRDIAGRPSEASVPLAMITPRDGAGPSTVLQSPTLRPGDAGKLSLDVIDYSETGPMVMAGRGPPGASVEVYLDNQPAGRAVIGSDGTWTVTPPTRVAPGQYTVRVDQIGKDGRVIARIEMPFTRGDAMQVAGGETQVVVQPGNSLWRIARRTYGAGMRFTLLYEANKEQIRDPDLIYPGQLFVVPKATNELRAAGGTDGRAADSSSVPSRASHGFRTSSSSVTRVSVVTGETGLRSDRLASTRIVWSSSMLKCEPMTEPLAITRSWIARRACADSALKGTGPRLAKIVSKKLSPLRLPSALNVMPW